MGGSNMKMYVMVVWSGDITDSWDRMMAIVDANAPLYNYSGPGHWNDPDMLEIGNGKMTWAEYRTHFSLWCLLKAPLLLGTDLPHLAPQGFEIITNSEVIAINQDTAGTQGQRVWSDKMGSYSSEHKADLRDEISELKRKILDLRRKESTVIISAALPIFSLKLKLIIYFSIS